MVKNAQQARELVMKNIEKWSPRVREMERAALTVVREMAKAGKYECHVRFCEGVDFLRPVEINRLRNILHDKGFKTCILKNWNGVVFLEVEW